MSCLLPRHVVNHASRQVLAWPQTAAAHLLRDSEAVDVVHHVQANVHCALARYMKNAP
jgi:hypothetical protein